MMSETRFKKVSVQLSSEEEHQAKIRQEFREYFQKDLADNLVNKDLSKYVISRMDFIDNAMLTRGYVTIEIPEGVDGQSYRINRRSCIERAFRSHLNDYVQTRNSDCFASEIAMYLAIFSPIGLEKLIPQIETLKVSQFTSLYDLSFSWVSEDILSHGNEEPEGEEFFSHMIYQTPVLISFLFEYAYEALGLGNAFSLMNEFLKLFSEEGFKNDSRIPVEIFINSVESCSVNSNYPIEWSMGQAFSKI